MRIWRAFASPTTGDLPRIIGLSAILLCALLLIAPRGATTADGDRSDPLISEFMAANVSVLADEEGDYSDWIEVHNPGSTDLDLEGWYLTDDDNDLTKWRFPPSRLSAGGYVVAFASGKDRARPGSELHTNFRLASDGEYLALVEPDGRTVAWEYAPLRVAEYPQQSVDVSFSRLGGLLRRRRVVAEYASQFGDVSYGLDAAGRQRYFTLSTPGRANASSPADLGPILSQAVHTPAFPAADDAILVTVVARESFAPLIEVMLHYRVMYGETFSVPMFDDGAHGDGEPGDSVYGATIPSEVYRPGEMVRYYVTATGQDGHRSRWPLFQDPLNSPRYFGTVITDPQAASELPTLHWFTQDVATARELQGARAQVYYNGILYDNVFVRARGYSSRSGWAKKSFKFEFNTGYSFRLAPDQPPVDEFDLNNTYADKAYVRQPLAWEAYRDAGAPDVRCFLMRVHLNGAFHSVAVYTEHPDERYLERQGLDPNGALYKMFSGADSATSRVSKKTRRSEDHSDLQALLDGVSLSGSARTRYLFDNLDIPAIVNYLAVTTILHDADCDRKNYYLYRDTEGTGEWTFLPWDKDLTFGRNFVGGVLNDQIWADHYPQSYPFNLGRNVIIEALYDTPAIRQMYLRRLRAVMDALLQPPGTPAQQLHFERRIDELVAQAGPDLALDAARWPYDWGSPQTVSEAIEALKQDYLAVRRVYLYETLAVGEGGIIPGAQPHSATVEFGSAMASDPASGDQRQEYFTLVNRNPFAVDISGWAVEGDVRYTFQPGVVIPAGGMLYVSPDVVAFRERAESPRGGEGRFVQGNYRGRLSNTWGLLKLYNADRMLVDTKLFGSVLRFPG